jgi:hypothetical protein
VVGHAGDLRIGGEFCEEFFSLRAEITTLRDEELDEDEFPRRVLRRCVRG